MARVVWEFYDRLLFQFCIRGMGISTEINDYALVMPHFSVLIVKRNALSPAVPVCKRVTAALLSTALHSSKNTL